MNLRAVFLARRAVANPDGTFDVQGGGITEFELPHGYLIGRPIRLEFAVVLRLEVDESELEQLTTIEVRIVFEGEQRGPVVNMPLLARRIPNATTYHHNVILNLNLDVPRPGVGSFRFTWEGGLIAVPAVYFRVGQGPSS